MASLTIRALSKRVFDFGKISVGSTQTLTVAERIDISQYIDGVLAVRVHAGDFSGGNVNVALHGDGFTDEDPGLGFVTAAALFSANLPSGPPSFITTGGTIRGHYAVIRVIGTRSSASPLTVTLSIDLAMRCPDEN